MGLEVQIFLISIDTQGGRGALTLLGGTGSSYQVSVNTILDGRGGCASSLFSHAVSTDTTLPLDLVTDG